MSKPGPGPARIWLVVGLVYLIVVAHVFLRLSDMPIGLKLTFTALNAAGWTIVLVPILFVDRWLNTIQKCNQDKDM